MTYSIPIGHSLAATVLVVLAATAACQSPPSPQAAETSADDAAQTRRMEWGMAIHGGAGTIVREQMTPEREQEYRAALTEALRVGYRVLEEGRASLDAVVAAIQI